MRSKARHEWRIAALALVVLALGAAVVGCGDDDDDESASSDPVALTIEATSAEPPAYTAPETVEAGVVEITLENNADAQIDGQLVRIDGEHADEEIVGELQNAMRGRPVQDWFQGAGGAPSTNPGESSTVTQVLEPGAYYVVGGDAPPADALTKITVEGEGGAELPEADGTIVATEYEFAGENLTAGTQRIEMRNEGEEWHHFLGGQLKEGATIEDAREFLETEKGAPPFAGSEDEGVGTAVFDGGISQIVEVDLKPGTYAFFCFIADRAGGPPHVAKGMVSEVTVEG
ncbi:MAG TPA: hypothetical protein VD790_06395 [Thermoleophilaceae bacterium]|nr:hypothetical protein [Thermoleophilaceae bacterium]